MDADITTQSASDIPPHHKYYRLFMLVPRETARALATSKEIKTLPGVWEFGKMPAASGIHAVNIFWGNVPHIGPAMLNAEGNPIARRRIDKKEIKFEECEPDHQPAALD